MESVERLRTTDQLILAVLNGIGHKKDVKSVLMDMSSTSMEFVLKYLTSVDHLIHLVYASLVLRVMTSSTINVLKE